MELHQSRSQEMVGIGMEGEVGMVADEVEMDVDLGMVGAEPQEELAKSN